MRDNTERLSLARGSRDGAARPQRWSVVAACRWVAKLAICLCVWVSWDSGAASGAESNQRASLFSGLEVIPAVAWKETSSDEKWRITALLIDHMQTNYAKIQTWKGTYRVRAIEEQSAAFLRQALGEKVATRALNNVELEHTFRLDFAIDLPGRRIYRAKQTDLSYWRDQKTDEQFSIPNTGPADERSFVAGEEYVHFDPTARWPEFSYLVNNPDAQHKRAAFREPAENGLRKHYGDMLDPRVFYGYGQDNPLWETLSFCLDSRNGKFGAGDRQKAEQLVHVFEADGQTSKLYRFDLDTVKSQPSDPELHNSWVFDGTVGFHPTGMRMLDGKDQKVQETQWRWKSVEGIYIPEVVLEHFFAFRGQVMRWRESELVDCRVNVPLDADQFTLRGLGLEEGDLVIDKIDRAVEILRDGQIVRLGAFGDQYVAPLPLTLRDSPLRVLFIGLNVLLLIGFLVWTMRRRTRVP